MKNPRGYATGPVAYEPRDYFDTLQAAEDDAQYKAETYLIPYFAFSMMSMQGDRRGEHRTLSRFNPPLKKKRKTRNPRIFGKDLTDSQARQIAKFLQEHGESYGRVRLPASKEVKQALYIIGVLDNPSYGVYTVRPGSSSPLGEANLGNLVPAPVLWEMVKPFMPKVGESIGSATINNSGMWKALGYYEPRQRNFSSRDREGMERVLLALDQAGYIIFSLAGSVSEVHRR